MNAPSAPPTDLPAEPPARQLAGFVHLRMHTEFSVVDGIVTVDAAVKRAAGDHMPALALTDLSNVFGLVKFYKAARGKGIKPIAGADVWITNADDRDKPTRLLLLCRDREGYGTLCRLLTRAYLENKHRGRAELRREWLRADDTGTAGLIALSGAQAGEVGQALLAGNREGARRLAREWAQLFGGEFHIELQRAGHPNTELYIAEACALASELALAVVATHPVEFLDPADFKAHEVRVCIAQGYVLADKRRPQEFTPQQYFKSAAEMASLFADIPEALHNSVEIARRCNLTLTLGKNYLPQFPTPPGMSIEDFMVAEAKAGLDKRLAQLYPEPALREHKRAEYEARLKFECDTIIQMGFPGYFLIVADFINWAKNNGVPVGPGRGSGAGSLVAYSLGITDLDPLAYALLFERFLNPERVSMPDFDVDFCQDNRWKVIEYVRQKYGADAVSQIATYGTMASRAVIRDVGRVLDMGYNFCDQLSKLIPVVQNKPLSLAEAREQAPQLKEREEAEEEVAQLLRLAEPLEGLTRNVGMHAGGVLIAPGKLTDFCPLYQQDGDDASPVSQFDKDDVEAIGLVKFDFLGLRNLTIIELAVDYIERMTGSRPDLLSLPFTDPAAYQILKDANTTAIFQLESEGMKKLLSKLAPDRFEDIIAVLALYRPGPLGSGMVDDFILRKKGQQKIDYFHPDLEGCLSPTYGVIVYQEQVMQISQIIGGYTLGGADMLRRAMGKKKPEEMAKHRETIAAGAAAKGYDPALAEQLFDLMTKFAEYGFNKSHTAAYAVVTYHTAWLKAHHCAAFMAASLSSDMDNTDTVNIFFLDAKKNRLNILPPDINASEYRFVPVSRSEIRYGLGAIKGTGEQAVNLIVAARQSGGPFQDLFDFCARVDKRQVNRRTIEALIRAGAFDSLDPDRAKLMASVSVAMEAAEQAAASANQGGLFDDAPAGTAPGAQYSTHYKPWGEREQLQNEKLAIGFYLSGHPYTAYQTELSRFVRRRLSHLESSREATVIAGMVVSSRVQMTRRGKMAFVVLDDGSAQIEVSVFNELFEASRHKLRDDELLVVEGRAQFDDYSNSMRVVADNLMSLGEARARFARRLELRINGEVAQTGGARAAGTRLRNLLDPFCSEAGSASGCPVRVLVRGNGFEGPLDLGERWRVRLEDELLDNLRDWLSGESVQVAYA